MNSHYHYEKCTCTKRACRHRGLWAGPGCWAGHLDLGGEKLYFGPWADAGRTHPMIMNDRPEQSEGPKLNFAPPKWRRPACSPKLASGPGMSSIRLNLRSLFPSASAANPGGSRRRRRRVISWGGGLGSSWLLLLNYCCFDHYC